MDGNGLDLELPNWWSNLTIFDSDSENMLFSLCQPFLHSTWGSVCQPDATSLAEEHARTGLLGLKARRKSDGDGLDMVSDGLIRLDSQ
ncbi:hypothetical protein VTL71DRAFT_13792 [Oculimacula yallundae]|uniref:Uncharacterized protein n=1 Tax=Oculimacula yallundae TaxID=86028 RepID=A0ABR4CLE6_9HELO